jgi:putative hydrolase of the HAD superfamily
MDGERVARAADVPFDAGRFRSAEAAAVAAVRRLVLERPESRDAERIPLYFDALLQGLGLDDESARRLAAGRIGDEHRRANLWSRAAHDASATLETLRARGYRLAVVSNADGRVRGLLESAGLATLLEFVVDSAEVGVEKPDPRIFHAATERLALAPAACAYVGDIYEIDVVGAARAGLSGILVGEGPAPASVLRVARLSGLPPLFPGLE